MDECKPLAAAPLSFLTSHLRSRHWWYEIVALDVRLLLGGALTPVIQHTGLHMTVVLMIMMGFLIATRDIDPYLNRARGGIENEHSTDVELPPPPSRVCMSIRWRGGRGGRGGHRRGGAGDALATQFCGK